MKKRLIPNWHEYFMLEAISASLRSKDPSTQVGCVFVDENNHQIVMGYNGFVSGVDENKFTWEKSDNLKFSEKKYAYVIHAEANAILHSNKDLKNSTLYVTLFPCNECAKMIATSKVKKIYFLEEKNRDSEINIASRKILDASGIKYKKISIRKKILNLYVKKIRSLMKF
jgi:dCMP deaminase